MLAKSHWSLPLFGTSSRNYDTQVLWFPGLGSSVVSHTPSVSKLEHWAI